MLSLPKRFLFGSQSKIDFKVDQLDGIARLYSERHVPYHDSKYWSRFLQLESAIDVFSLLSLADLRRARRDAPENVVTLVRVMVAHLDSLLLDPLFEPPPPVHSSGLKQDGLTSRLNGLTDVSRWKVPGASLVGLEAASTVSASSQRDRTKEALNVIRILSRTLPAVMESDDESFESQVLWTEAPEASIDATSSQTTAASSSKVSDNNSAGSRDGRLDNSAQFVIDDDEDEDEDAGHITSSETQVDDLDHPLSSADQDGDKPEVHDGKEGPTPVALGERLLRITVDLLFCSGFTLPWTEDELEQAAANSPPRRVNYSIWEAGVGSSIDLPGTSHFHVSNRVEVLRLLLVLLSKSIYIPPSKQMTEAEPLLKFAVQDLDRSTMLPLLCSLINTSITNAHNSTSAWLGLPSVSGLVSGSNDEVRIGLVTMSLQVLDILLAYVAPHPGDSETVSLSTIGRPQPGPGGRNVFRFYLSKLHRTADFDFIWSGLVRSFNEHISSTIQILAIPIPTGGQGRRAAGTSWQLSQVAERLILLWRLLEHNHKFRLYVLDDAKRAPELLTILLYFSLTYKDNVALQGLVRLCVFMLQDVSSERAFAVNLAKPGSAAKVQLPSRLGLLAGNTAIDFLVQGVYSLVAGTKGQLASLYAPLAISLSNTAPAWRNISITASTRVIHLLRSFSQPSFLLSEEGNPRLLFYVLETINAVLTVGYSANVNLVYSLVLARGLIDALESFSLRKGVEEIWKRRRALGTDTRDWFENAPRLEKPPLAPISPATQQHPASVDPEADGAADNGDTEMLPSAVTKGKMRRISTSSSDLPSASIPPAAWEGELSRYPLEAVEEAAASFIGKHAFRPTQDWVSSWHSALPLSTPRLVIEKLLPEIERISAGGGVKGSNNIEITGGDTDARVLAFLREQPMSEWLPPPAGGIHARAWHWTDQGEVWLRSYLWGTVYVSGLLPYGLWSDTEVRLFRIHGAGGGEGRRLLRRENSGTGSGQGGGGDENGSHRSSTAGSESAATPGTLK